MTTQKNLQVLRLCNACPVLPICLMGFCVCYICITFVGSLLALVGGSFVWWFEWEGQKMADDMRVGEAPARVPVWQWVVAGALLVGGAYSCASRWGGSAVSPEGVGRAALVGALMLCTDALRVASLDPERAVVPVVENLGRGGAFYFAWGPGSRMLRFRNGLGAEVAASGSCTVAAGGKRITGLTLNGRAVLGEWTGGSPGG